mmetsp:Transcript_57388/g.105549  ORF Transcript_57388/g.105549 Transcript_57388/m.105549 type:complete len:201 (-) Transcript_57388:66-668(-)
MVLNSGKKHGFSPSLACMSMSSSKDLRTSASASPVSSSISLSCSSSTSTSGYSPSSSTTFTILARPITEWLPMYLTSWTPPIKFATGFPAFRSSRYTMAPTSATFPSGSSLQIRNRRAPEKMMSLYILMCRGSNMLKTGLCHSKNVFLYGNTGIVSAPSDGVVFRVCARSSHLTSVFGSLPSSSEDSGRDTSSEGSGRRT